MRKTLLAAVLPIACLSLLAGAAQDASPTMQIIEGTTAPSERRSITFNSTGVIKEVMVQAGDVVKRGQLLMKLNDEVEQARLVSLKADADVTLKVRAAEKQRDVTEIEYQNKLRLFKNNKAATEFEVQTAEAERDVRAISVDVSRQEGDIKQTQVLVQERRLQDMVLASPIDGVVVEVRSKEGEIAAESRPVVDIVKLDPLYIEVKLASPKQVQQLKAGQPIKVRYADGQWMDAKVKFISPIVDASSGRQSFRLEVPNPEQRAAGLPMQVQLPLATAAAQ